VKVLWLLPARRVGAPSGGDLYDRLIVAGLQRLGHEVEVRSTLPKRVNAELVVQDELGFERFSDFNRELERQGHPARRVALVHVTTAKLEPAVKSAAAEAAYLASTHAAVFVSEQARAESSKLLGVPRGFLTAVIPPGSDRLSAHRRRTFAPRTFHDTRPGVRLICVGHLLPHKGQLALLDSFARCRMLDARLVLVGDGTIDRRYTAQVTARLRRVPNASWVGPLAGAALARALASSDVFVSAARYESWGMAAAEAHAAGLPIVSWSKGGLWEFLTPGLDSLKANEPSPVVLDRLADAELLKRLKQGACKAPKRTWAQAAREFASLLRRVAR
jgi:glycosyltransferase involved in cell wall biosynthesis